MTGWAIEPLGSLHDRAAFDCGHAAISGWIRTHAGQFARRDLARVYVLVREGDARVLGYYTLSSCQIQFEAETLEEFRKYPRMPLPAALIGKLATDLSIRGQGLGGFLLIDALRRVQHLADQVGVCAVVVDAIDEDARRFYLHFGFAEIVNEPRRLFLPVHLVRKLNLPPLVEPAGP